MAKFLNTSGTTYHLEELIKNARDRVILISPFLKLNDRIRELLADKNRLKIDIRIVYGKSELQPEEVRWLNELTFVRTSFCKNLHAKCYLSEEQCIITSLNLYEFSQVNNNEMGILIERGQDGALYQDAYDEAQRIIRISEEVRIAMERVNDAAPAHPNAKTAAKPASGTAPSSTAEKTAASAYSKLTTAKLAAQRGLKTSELQQKLMALGHLELRDEKPFLTETGKTAGGEFRTSVHGGYFLWPDDLKID